METLLEIFEVVISLWIEWNRYKDESCNLIDVCGLGGKLFYSVFEIHKHAEGDACFENTKEFCLLMVALLEYNC